MHRNRVAPIRTRRPFWLPASNYYILSVAFTIALFFLIWGILQDSGEPTPFIPAGVAAAVILAAAVLLREVILRNARARYLNTQRQLERNLLYARAHVPHGGPKLTLERNAAIIKEIKIKSDAARVLNGLPEAHREVFDMCEEYLAAANRELPTVNPGSPRIAALRKGTRSITEVHHYHLLRWAEMQSQAHTMEAKSRTRVSQKLEAVEEAISVINFALQYYPFDEDLLGSERVLRDLVASIELGHILEKADKAVEKGNKQRALVHYKNALSHIKKHAALQTEAADTVDMINREVARLAE
jgi:hypothetical protein